MTKLLSKIVIVLLLIGLTACHSSRKTATSNHSTKDPRFIDHVSIGGKGSNYIHMRVMEGKQDRREPDGTIIITRKEKEELQEKYASKVGVKDKAIANLTLYTFINDWYGVRYKLGGTTKRGIDCSGFAQRLYAEVYGMDLVRTSYEQFAQCKHISNPARLQEGDLVFFGHKKHVTHVGVYLSNHHFVHASTSDGVMISSLEEPYWQSCYVGGGKIAGSAGYD